MHSACRGVSLLERSTQQGGYTAGAHDDILEQNMLFMVANLDRSCTRKATVEKVQMTRYSIIKVYGHLENNVLQPIDVLHIPYA